MDLTPIWRRFASRRVAAMARASPAGLQEAQLRRLLAKAARTRFGREHDFARLRSVGDYQRAVPLRDYEKFHAEYWGRSFPHLADLTWPGRIALFATTSGTASGAVKRVPVSEDMIVALRRATLETYVWHLARNPASRVLAGRNFIFGGTASLHDVAAGVREGFVSGITSARMPWWLRMRTFPPREVNRIADWGQRADAIAALAGGVDVRAIAGMPCWLLPLFERMAEKRGTERTLKVLWPQLSLLVHGGMPIEPYLPLLEPWLAGLEVDRREIYMASEGLIAIADRGPGEGLRLNLDMGLFFEFVPADEIGSPAPRRFWLGNVEPGVDYAMVLTTCAGLWSYAIGDIVRFVDVECPRILFSGRVGHGLSTFGEHLLMREIDTAVVEASRSLGIIAAEYAVAPIMPAQAGKTGRHRFFVESTAVPGGDRAGEFAEAVDRLLARINTRYEYRREGRVLSAPEVRFVPPGTFGAWMKRHNRIGGQYKVPRILTDAALHADLRAHLENAATTRPVPELSAADYG
jgi:hypothetical protein